MPLSKETIEQISNDAMEYAKVIVRGPTEWVDVWPQKRKGYIKGATVEAGKSKFWFWLGFTVGVVSILSAVAILSMFIKI